MTYIINNISAIQEFYIAGIRKNANNGHNRNILETVL